MYIAYSKTAADSAKLLAEKTGVSCGPLKNYTNGAILYFGVPSKEEVKTQPKTFTFGNFSDIRSAYENKASLLKKINTAEALDGTQITIFSLGGRLLCITSSRTRTRKEVLLEKLGKDLLEELYSGGHFADLNEQSVSVAEVSLSPEVLTSVNKALETIESDYNLGLFSLQADVDGNEIYFTNMFFSPSLLKVPTVVDRLAKCLSSYEGDLALLKNKMFFETLSNQERLIDIVNKASVRDLAAVSHFFGLISKACVEGKNE